MFTTGSKFFFGLAAAALVAGVVYWFDTNLDFFGVIVLLSLGRRCRLHRRRGHRLPRRRPERPGGGSLVGRRRRGRLARARGCRPACGRSSVPSAPAWSPSVSSTTGAGSWAACVVLDRHHHRVGRAGVVGPRLRRPRVQRRRPGPPACTRSSSPSSAPSSVGLVIFGFSRVMLAIPKSAAVGVFIGVGALVLVIAAVLSTPRRRQRGRAVVGARPGRCRRPHRRAWSAPARVSATSSSNHEEETRSGEEHLQRRRRQGERGRQRRHGQRRRHDARRRSPWPGRPR